MIILKLLVLCIVIIMILLPIEMILALIYCIHQIVEFVKEWRRNNDNRKSR